MFEKCPVCRKQLNFSVPSEAYHIIEHPDYILANSTQYPKHWIEWATDMKNRKKNEVYKKS